MKKIGEYLSEVIRLNQSARNFRLFSPDETYSNRLQDVFKNTTRSLAGPIETWDKDLSCDGRVIEMLSEQSLQGLFQGYLLTGRFAVFPTYEAFAPVVTSMVDQFTKFMKVARQTTWRGDIPSANYILTSTGWRQEHNGFSHQNPGFIDNLLSKKHDFINIYFPADANEALVLMEKCLKSKNEINVLVIEKTVESVWLTLDQAKQEVKDGMSIWPIASDDNPDIVFGSSGQYLVKETLAAIDLLKQELSGIKIRFINVAEVSPNTIGHDTEISLEKFEKYFTKDKPVIFNFHGYPDTLEKTIFSLVNKANRLSIHGYLESGSTTTALDLHIRNKTDRYNLFIEAIEKLQVEQKVSQNQAIDLINKYQTKIAEHKKYILEHGDDPAEILNWQWPY